MHTVNQGFEGVLDKGCHSVTGLKYQELTLEITLRGHLHTDTSPRIDRAQSSHSAASLHRTSLKFS